MRTKTHTQSFLFRLSNILIITALFAATLTLLGKATGTLPHAAFAGTLESSATPGRISAADAGTRKGLPSTELSINSRIAKPQSCPPGTTLQMVGGQAQCRVDYTLELASNTTLDCKNIPLVPVTQGTGVNPWPSSRSDPEVAVFLHNVRNVTIQNCPMDGFDFGIFALDIKDWTPQTQSPLQGARKTAKMPARARKKQKISSSKTLPFIPIKIINNQISARFLPLTLMLVDKAQITGNTLTYNTIGGRGLYVGHNSDSNVINQNNQIIANLSTAARGAVRVPGPSDASSNPVTGLVDPDASSAVLITHTEGPEPALLNVVMKRTTAVANPTLYQITVEPYQPPEDTPYPEDLSENNLFEGNIITFNQYPNDGIVVAGANRTVLRGNTIQTSSPTASIRFGIRVGIQTSKLFPSTCDLDRSRYCLSDSDCQIAALNEPSKGHCNPAPATSNVSWLARYNLIEGNKITGLFNTGIAQAGINTTLQDNTITGQLSSAQQGQGIGLTLFGKYPLETATITRNTVSNVDTALKLQQVFQGLPTSSFLARIGLNDFLSSRLSVLIDDNYSLTTKLSVNGQGNFWGIICANGGFDQNKVKTESGALVPAQTLTDDHPFGVSVAQSGTGIQPCR
jgi:hypothetical protein